MVPDPLDPSVPGVTPDISSLTGQVYGAHEFRGRFDIGFGAQGEFTVLHRNVEMIWYTVDTDLLEFDTSYLAASLSTVFFIPILPVNPRPPVQSVIYETTAEPLTEIPSSSERQLWSVQGTRIVGRDRRQLILTEASGLIVS